MPGSRYAYALDKINKNDNILRKKILIIIISMSIINKSKYNNYLYEIYSYSFTEANHLSSLEVIASESLEFLFSSNKLVFFDNANDE